VVLALVEKIVGAAGPVMKNELPYVHAEPFYRDEVRRAQLRAELDSYYTHLYGLTRDELRYILERKIVV